jgi:uncharacterized protein (TIGR03083 family)
MQLPPSRQPTDIPELLSELRATRDEVLAALRELDPDRLDGSVYEDGWDARQLAAHLSSIEWTYPRLLELPEASGAARGAPRDSRGIDDYNRRQVDKRADVSLADLIAEFERNRAATIAAVESAPPEMLSRTVRTTGGTVGTLSDVIRFTAIEHVRTHLRDLTGRTSAPLV